MRSRTAPAPVPSPGQSRRPVGVFLSSGARIFAGKCTRKKDTVKLLSPDCPCKGGDNILPDLGAERVDAVARVPERGTAGRIPASFPARRVTAIFITDSSSLNDKRVCISVDLCSFSCTFWIMIEIVIGTLLGVLLGAVERAHPRGSRQHACRHPAGCAGGPP